MHKASLLRMQWFVENYASKIEQNEVKVLDVGSFDVNGSYRHLFDGQQYQYTGLDMEKGPNVDVVLSHPYNWSAIETDSFDVVISGQAFEHMEYFWKAMEEMTRVLKKDGLLCLIVPNGFSEHRYPVDCYRFFTDGMIALARYTSLESLHAHTNCAPEENDFDWYSETHADSMLVARKPYNGTPKHPDFKNYVCTPENHKIIRSGLFPYKKNRVISKKESESLLQTISTLQSQLTEQVEYSNDLYSNIEKQVKYSQDLYKKIEEQVEIINNLQNKLDGKD